MYIPDDTIEQLGSELMRIADLISKETNTSSEQTFEQLVVFLGNNYVKTATHDEKESRYLLDRSNTNQYYYGTRYNFNEVPDWELFKTRLYELLK
ncbi:hypothetical protein D3C87_2012500 [compost metagenome]